MSQLVALRLSAVFCLFRMILVLRFHIIHRRDQSQILVKDSQQFLKLTRLAVVARCFLKRISTPHRPLDIRANRGQQRRQQASHGLLMLAMLDGGVSVSEHFFKKGHADAFDAAHFTQRRCRPVARFHHVGENGNPNRDHFAILRQTIHGLADKLVLVLIPVFRAVG